MPFGIQPMDIIVIVVVALIVFGPKRLPQFGRWIGKTFSEFRKGARDMADGFKEETATKNGDGGGTTAPSGNFCTACGAGNPADARFCNKCGIRLPE